MSTYYIIDPILYDDQFWWKKDDIEFWKQCIGNTRNSVLELAAGTGRISLPLLRENFAYQGLELSSKYVKYANQKLRLSNLQPAIIQGDMTAFSFKKKFDFIFIGFNSFLHLLTNQDASKCLQCVNKHMHSQSTFIIDIFVPHPLVLYKPSTLKVKNFSFVDSQIKQKVDVLESIDYNEKTEIMDIHWDYIDIKKNESYRTFDFKMKMFFPETIHNLLYDNGFVIDQIWGDYDLSRFSEDSSLQIYKCSKR